MVKPQSVLLIIYDELEIHINTFFENKSLKDLLNNNKETRV